MKCLHTLLVSVCAFFLMAGKTTQNDQQHEEYTTKALFIYHFTRHIEWPAPASMNNRFLICIHGKSEIRETLQEALKGRKIMNMPVEIRDVSKPEEAAGAQLIYISRGRAETAQVFIDDYYDKPVLILTEDRHMIQKGSCINLLEKDSRLRFELSENNIRKKGLKVSSQLSRLAILIR